MQSMWRKAFYSIVFAFLASASTLSARAQSFDFTYSGSDSGAGVASFASAIGSFTVDAGGNATAFSATLSQTCTVSFCGAAQVDTFTYGLGDLTSFNATVVGGNVTALSFATNQLPAQFGAATAFIAQTGDQSGLTLNLDFGPITLGTITVQPSALAAPGPMPGGGLLSLVWLALGRARRWLRRPGKAIPA